MESNDEDLEGATDEVLDGGPNDEVIEGSGNDDVFEGGGNDEELEGANAFFPCNSSGVCTG